METGLWRAEDAGTADVTDAVVVRSVTGGVARSADAGAPPDRPPGSVLLPANGPVGAAVGAASPARGESVRDGAE
ncbi:hypothetical protein [Streptomyces sp. NPDC046759]|uniref:hypothetical protein n=1 Tax=Streptomyces sp. NPDC046759 TaxID=3155019 RepID=UPI0033E84ED1